MTISEDSIIEFKRIFAEKYNVEMSDEEVRESVQNLVDVFALLMKIDQRNKKDCK